MLPFLGLRTLLCLCANTNQASYTIPVFNKHERQSSFINFISFHQASIKLLTTKQSRLAILKFVVAHILSRVKGWHWFTQFAVDFQMKYF